VKADSEQFLNLINDYNADCLRSLALSLHEELEDLKFRQSANERIYTEAHIQYSELEKKYNSLLKENTTLKEHLAKEIDKNTLKARSTFGRKTEQFLSLVDAADNKIDEPEDERQVEAEEQPDERKSRVINFTDHKKNDIKKNSKLGKGKCNGSQKQNRLAASMEKLPKQLIYDFDPETLDQEYGQYNWRIAFWHCHTTLEKLDSPYYAKTVYTPVISSGLEHVLTTVPYANPLLEKSAASSSVIADILYHKFVLGLPFYRQAVNYQMNGIELLKQTIINWVNRLVPEIMGPVCDYLTECLLKYKYTQNDETYIQVNKDGRGPGHKSYMWIHCSSELLDCNPIIIFCYEATRGTDHLRSFFREFLGYITCDAYVSYQVLEDEKNGLITVTGCMMHCRRYFAEAFFVNDVAELSNEQLLELPETKALMLIRDIYHEENQLKDLNSEDRTVIRKKKVEPKVDQFFEYVHSLEASDEVFSDRMNKAITYAVNQEEHLMQFLTDGNISIDNGYAERVIRSYSVGRSNWLFADTVIGAKINALMYSVVETAKANHVNVRCYLQYLLEEIPKHLDQSDKSFLKDMVPWSDAYHSYESQKEQADEQLLQGLFPEPERPRTPRKRDLVVHTPSEVQKNDELSVDRSA
jgi:transposase